MSGVAAVGLMAIAGVARCGLGLVAMAVGALSRHAKLAFDGAARGLVLRVELHMLGIFLRDRGQRLVAIELGLRVGFDFAHNALEMPQRRATTTSFRAISAA